MGRKKKFSLRSIDDFVHVLEIQNTQVIAPIEHEYIEENLEEAKHSDTTEVSELSSHTYVTNSPSIDDDFLGGVSTSTPILDSETYVLPHEESPPSSDDLLNQKEISPNSLFFPFKDKKKI